MVETVTGASASPLAGTTPPSEAPVLHVHALEGYTFVHDPEEQVKSVLHSSTETSGQGEPHADDEFNKEYFANLGASATLEKLEELRRFHDLNNNATRRSVEAVMLVHVRGHPHLLLLQKSSSSSSSNPGDSESDVYYSLPGAYLGANGLQDPVETLRNRMSHMLCRHTSATDQSAEGGDFKEEDLDNADWDIAKENLGTWYRPNFETFWYPYLPPHITKSKETKQVFLVHLAPGKTIRVPRNCAVVAVPFFELYDNASRFGTQIAIIPVLLSRFNIVFHTDHRQQQ